MNVYIVMGNHEQFGVYTKERRALARQEELVRVGVFAVVSEVYLNEDHKPVPECHACAKELKDTDSFCPECGFNDLGALT